MRETRLCDYGPATDDGDNTATVFISIPNALPSPNQASSQPSNWAGLVTPTITWRTLDAAIIQLENLLTDTTLRIIFSAPICTRPLLQPTTLESGRTASTTAPSTTHISIVLACFAQASGSTVLHMHVPQTLTSTPGNPHVTERVRDFLPAVRVTSLLADGSEVLLALSDGQCMSMSLTGPPEALKPFRCAHTNAATASETIAPSLMRRLFPVRTVQVRSSALAMARVHARERAVAVLYADARIIVFVHGGEGYAHAGECQLPCELSQNAVQHFLLARGDGNVLAVILANEHPTTDSLRVYDVRVEVGEGEMIVHSSHVETREGPIPRILSAIFFSDDVVVATASGIVTGIVNAPEPRARVVPADGRSRCAETEQGGWKKGLPTGMFWTVVDDLTEAYGLSATMDRLQDERENLQAAHQLSAHALAKALRLPDEESVTAGMVRSAVARLEVGDDESVWKRLKTRAEQVAKMEDMRVRDVSWHDAVGLVIARERSVFVMRPLFEVEKRLHPAWEDLLSVIQHTPSGPTAWFLSSHAVVQKLAACFLDNEANSRVKFTLRLVTRFSECMPDIPLTDLFCSKRAHLCTRDDGMDAPFPNVLVMCEKMLSPGAMLLGALLSTLEMDCLGQAAEEAADDLPISSMFAHGLVWLERYKKEMDGRMDEDGLRQEVSPREDTNSGMLRRAYGFFIFAAQGCDENAKREDVFCAMGLAGYPAKVPTGTEMEVDDDDWRAWTIPRNDDMRPNDVIRLGDCAFWLLERVLRLMEAYGLPKTGAAAALEAMTFAPDKQSHEQMRSAAFSRFLEAGELECALKAILSEPFANSAEEMNLEESDALRDCIGLFINATADRNKLLWLADQDLPEPLRMLAGQALERRARGSDVLPTAADFSGSPNHDTFAHAYEDAYAWHTLRTDFASAARCALEWFDRLSAESAAMHPAQTAAGDEGRQRAALALSVCEYKQHALGLAQSALRLLPEDGRFVRRSPFAAGLRGGEPFVVSCEWVQARLLLCQAQMQYVGDAICAGRFGDWTGVLDDGPAGVEWVCSVLLATGRHLHMCAGLGVAWRDGVGDGVLTSVVEEAGRMASRRDVVGFGYADLARFLEGLDAVCGRRDGRNLYVVALKSAVRTGAGRSACPQWLVDRAAFGRADSGGCACDLPAVVSVLLRNSRPVDAARVLLNGLDRALRSGEEDEDGGREFMSFTAVDATLETLGQVGGDYGIAERVHKQLRERTKEYLNICERTYEERVA